jgi:hypothetical protein
MCFVGTRTRGCDGDGGWRHRKREKQNTEKKRLARLHAALFAYLFVCEKRKKALPKGRGWIVVLVLSSERRRGRAKDLRGFWPPPSSPPSSSSSASSSLSTPSGYSSSATTKRQKQSVAAKASLISILGLGQFCHWILFVFILFVY